MGHGLICKTYLAYDSAWGDRYPNKDVKKAVEHMAFELRRSLDCSCRYEVTRMNILKSWVCILPRGKKVKKNIKGINSEEYKYYIRIGISVRIRISCR